MKATAVDLVSPATAPGSRFRRNVLRIASGTILSQGILVAGTPALTRLYGPEDFGALAVFTSLYAVLIGLSTLKFETAIILPDDTTTARDLTALTMIVSGTFSCALALILLGASQSSLHVPSYYLFLPAAVLLGAAFTCAQQWGARFSDYRNYARSQVLNAAVNVSVALLLGLLASRLSDSLVIGYLAGLAAALAYMLRDMRWHSADTDLRPQTRLRRLVGTARQYRHFPQFVLPSTFISTLSVSSQPFLLQTLFSLREVGHYAIANRFLLLPAAIIGGAVGEAFRAEFVARLRRGEFVAPFLVQTLRKLLTVAVPVFATFFVAAPRLFAVMFGTAYAESGEFARYLCVGAAAQFVSQPFVYVFVATGHARRGLLVQAPVTALPMLGLLIGGWLGDIRLALILSSLLALCVCAVMARLAYRCCVAVDADARQREVTAHV